MDILLGDEPQGKRDLRLGGASVGGQGGRPGGRRMVRVLSHQCAQEEALGDDQLLLCDLFGSRDNCAWSLSSQGFLWTS